MVVVVAIGLSWVLDLQAHGVAVVGAIPAGLPSFAVPRPAWRDVIQLLPAAVGVFLVSFADEILTARSFAGKHNQHVRAPQELLAMGTANAAAGFTQGFSVGASGSRTAVNDSMGARSQVAGLVAAAAVLAIVVFLTEPVQYLQELDAKLHDLVASVKAQGLEGLVAKRRDSRYEPGLRSGAWQKMRVNQGQEFVIGGYTVGSKTFDALIFGYYDGDTLIYAARTRNGFTPVVRQQLMKKFRGLEIRIARS